MVFNSFEYLVFLPVVFLAYWLVFKSIKGRNLFIIAASYVFYGWWDWRFLALIILSTLCGYVCGLSIGANRERGRKPAAKIILWLNILLNLGVLFTFKYFDFFSHSFSRIAELVGWYPDSVTLDLVLPVGISFYTFQVLSYTIDVYRGDMKATHDAAAFFAYICFFPQLVAGPIERATNLIPQFQRQRFFTYAEGIDGLKMILWGLFKKMVVADNCAAGDNVIFADYETAGALNLWAGMILFTFQIYGDFSGYSDIAVGSARLFGIRLMQNFRTPYFSRSMGEFWRRWHISLSQWLRDYVYIPLGGSRKSSLRTSTNLLIVFLASGLWHGANFTFIAWGAYQSVFVIPESAIRRIRGKRSKYEVETSRDLWAIVFTFIIIAFGWVIFRAPDLSTAVNYIRLMFTDFHFDGPQFGMFSFVWIALLLIDDWMMRGRRHGLDFPDHGLWRQRWFRWTFYIVTTMIVLIFSGTSQQFVYFQF